MTDDAEQTEVVAATLIPAEKQVMLTRSDGKIALFPIESLQRDESSRVARVSYILGRNILYVETDLDDAVVLELPSIVAEAPIGDRIVVYLDQNHWSTLAKLIHDPDRVSKSERKAGLALIQALMEQRVLLPVSAGHMSETCKWNDGQARYRHGLSILRLSAGWQLRDPLDLRRRELIEALVGRFGGTTQPEVSAVTLAADAMHAGRDEYWFAPRPELSETKHAVASMTSAVVLAQVLLDREVIEVEGGEGWVLRLQEITTWLGSSGKDKQQKRKVVDAFFLSDIQKEVAQAAAYVGIGPGQLEEWVQKFSSGDIESSATLSIFRQIMRDKIGDSQTIWERNDLNDIFYLSCAAGHVDHLVCERRTASYLLQAQKRAHVRATVHRSLNELVERLEL